MTSIVEMAKQMNDVERHGLVYGGDIEPLANGDYVLFTDYEKLQSELATLRQQLQAAQAEVSRWRQRFISERMSMRMRSV